MNALIEFRNRVLEQNAEFPNSSNVDIGRNDFITTMEDLSSRMKSVSSDLGVMKSYIGTHLCNESNQFLNYLIDKILATLD